MQVDFLTYSFFFYKKKDNFLNKRNNLFPFACPSLSEERKEREVRKERWKGGGWSAASVSNEFRISLADGRRDYFKEIRNYLIRREKVINPGETN